MSPCDVTGISVGPLVLGQDGGEVLDVIHFLTCSPWSEGWKAVEQGSKWSYTRLHHLNPMLIPATKKELFRIVNDRGRCCLKYSLNIHVSLNSPFMRIFMDLIHMLASCNRSTLHVVSVMLVVGVHFS